ncbi:hypothetical protein ACSBR2_020810 [Camellia fascicularis]
MLHQGSRQNQYDVFKVSTQLNEKSSNSAAVPEAKSEEPAKESPAQKTVPDASSISTFMTQVAHVVKCVKITPFIWSQSVSFGWFKLLYSLELKDIVFKCLECIDNC